MVVSVFPGHLASRPKEPDDACPVIVAEPTTEFLWQYSRLDAGRHRAVDPLGSILGGGRISYRLD